MGQGIAKTAVGSQAHACCSWEVLAAGWLPGTSGVSCGCRDHLTQNSHPQVPAPSLGVRVQHELLGVNTGLVPPGGSGENLVPVSSSSAQCPFPIIQVSNGQLIITPGHSGPSCPPLHSWDPGVKLGLAWVEVARSSPCFKISCLALLVLLCCIRKCSQGPRIGMWILLEGCHPASHRVTGPPPQPVVSGGNPRVKLSVPTGPGMGVRVGWPDWGAGRIQGGAHTGVGLGATGGPRPHTPTAGCPSPSPVPSSGQPGGTAGSPGPALSVDPAPRVSALSCLFHHISCPAVMGSTFF